MTHSSPTTRKPRSIITRSARLHHVLRMAAACLWLTPASCESSFERIDRHTQRLLDDATTGMGGDAIPPAAVRPPSARASAGPRDERLAEQPPTINPAADELRFRPQLDPAQVVQRLEQYSELPAGTLEIDFAGALAYAVDHGREYRFAEEEYVLAALRLMSERHLWGPRLFDDLAVEANADADSELFDSSLTVVNELRLAQRLPFGGNVSARLLAEAAEDLHQFVAGEDVQSAELILEADLPLLRGAGYAARESRIQAERDLIYAARDFERFRREYLFDIASDFLNLVVQIEQIINAERQVESFVELERREQGLVDSGRSVPFEAALAQQDTLFARDTLNSRREVYRVALDRFKVRLGMPVEQPLAIIASVPELPAPLADISDAVGLALRYRLDLQSARDRIEDSKRDVDIARNNLLPALNLTGSVSVPTDESLDHAGLQLDDGEVDASAGLALSLPLDREIERLALRQEQIDLERSIRDYEELRDNVALAVRASIREVDSAQFSLSLQEQNIEVAQRRQASIDAAPDRATARDRSEATEQLLRALDDRDRSKRDLQVSILRYLLNTDQLRVAANGEIRPLPGMTADSPQSGGEAPVQPVVAAEPMLP